MSSFSSPRGAISRNSGGGRHLLDPMKNFYRALFDTRRGNCDRAAMISIFSAKKLIVWTFSNESTCRMD
jgi:hypothetical protein